MKKIEAIIRSAKFEETKKDLHKIGIDSFSFWDCYGFGNEEANKKKYPRTSMITRKYIAIIVKDADEKKIFDCLMKVAFTGKSGDGLVFVSGIEKSGRISSGVLDNLSLA